MNSNNLRAKDFLLEELRESKSKGISDRRNTLFVLFAFLERTDRAENPSSVAASIIFPAQILSDVNGEFGRVLSEELGGGGCSINAAECQQIIDELCALGFVERFGPRSYRTAEPLRQKLKAHLLELPE